MNVANEPDGARLDLDSEPEKPCFDRILLTSKFGAYECGRMSAPVVCCTQVL